MITYTSGSDKQMDERNYIQILFEKSDGFWTW